jgi:Membrane domain of glycerophosphoryl diester phosphodiesterase
LAAYDLRPLSVGEILDRTFTLYRGHFWLFAGIMAIPSSIHVPMNFYIFDFWTRAITAQARGQVVTPPPGVFAVYLVFMPLFWSLYSLGLGAMTNAVSDVYLGRATSIRAAYRKVFGRFWRLVGLIITVGLMIFGIMFAIMVTTMMVFGIVAAAIGSAGGTGALAASIMVISMLAAFGGAFAAVAYVGMLFAVSIPALMVENQQVPTAIRRSVELTRGKRWSIFMGVLLTIMISYAAVMFFQGPFLLATVFLGMKGNVPIWLSLVTALSGAAGGAVSSPLIMIVLVTFYYDLRIRKEAFDLQHMMATLDQGRLTQTVSPA